MKIFISYAGEDLETAKRVYEDLESHGYDPWMDTRDILPGQEWNPATIKAVRHSDVFICLVSRESVAKRGTAQGQLKTALEVLEEFSESDIFLIPARVDDCEVPFRLEHLNRVDLFPDYESGFDRLLRALETKRPDSGHTVFSKADPAAHDGSLPTCIYISYALIGNEGDWVTTLAGNLETETARRLGGREKFTISMDQRVNIEDPELPGEMSEIRLIRATCAC